MKTFYGNSGESVLLDSFLLAFLVIIQENNGQWNISSMPHDNVA